jgi:hypothetical protein
MVLDSVHLLPIRPPEPVPELPPNKSPHRRRSSSKVTFPHESENGTFRKFLEEKRLAAGPDGARPSPAPSDPALSALKLDDFGKYPYTIWDFFPATCTCPHDIQRVGRLGDGGKWVWGMSLYEARETPTRGSKHPTQNTFPRRDSHLQLRRER